MQPNNTDTKFVALDIKDGESPIGGKCVALWFALTSLSVACSSGFGALAGAWFEGSFPGDHYTAGRVAGAVALGTLTIQGIFNCCLVPIFLTTGKWPNSEYSNPCSDVIRQAGESAIAGLVGYGLIGGGAMTAASIAAGSAVAGAIAGGMAAAFKSCCGLYSGNNE